MGIKKQRGSAILEFAIGASVFVLFFTGVFQFGYTLFVYNKLENAVRAGARYGAMSIYRTAGATVNSAPTSTFVDQIKNVTAYGNPNGAASGSAAIVSGLSPDHVMVSVSFANNTPSAVTVSISGLSVYAVFGTWNANGKPNATFQYVGRYAPPII